MKNPSRELFDTKMETVRVRSIVRGKSLKIIVGMVLTQLTDNEYIQFGEYYEQMYLKEIIKVINKDEGVDEINI